MMLNEAALRWMNDLSAQGIIITDAELKVLVWNHWLEVRSTHLAADMIGRGLLDVYPELVERGLDKYYKDALAGQVRMLSHRLHIYLLPMSSPEASTSYPLMQQSARIAPLIEGDRVIGTITVIDDVTERAEYEDQLVRLLARERNARKEAETANRTKDEFLATVSHELRTPLNAISGWVQILRKKEFDPAFIANGLEIIERNVKIQVKIIEDILDVSRIVTGKLSLNVTTVDLGPIIEAALESVRLAADAKGIKISRTLDARAGSVSGDPGRLQQVIWNLVSNAIKFTPKGGAIDVRLSRVDSQAEIRVSDNGKGISPEFLPYVFERFRQADSTSARQHSGLGLGLAIVRHLVEMHGGTVHASSEGEGKGATFIVRIPFTAVRVMKESSRQAEQRKGNAEGSQVIERDGSPADDAAQLSGLRLLIVDDEPDAREMLQVMLGQYGIQVKTSASVQEALELLECWKPDVLISDVGMPNEDGYALILRVRALGHDRGGNIPAIALTGYSRLEDRSQLLAAGYQMHLSKPVELARLVNAIMSLSGRAEGEYYSSVE
jgi:signal transduction histidine kinase/ActR/RegA family two-component response regulator